MWHILIRDESGEYRVEAAEPAKSLVEARRAGLVLAEVYCDVLLRHDNGNTYEINGKGLEYVAAYAKALRKLLS